MDKKYVKFILKYILNPDFYIIFDSLYNYLNFFLFLSNFLLFMETVERLPITLFSYKIFNL